MVHGAENCKADAGGKGVGGDAKRMKGTSPSRVELNVARINGDATVANAEMVRIGLAWVFDRYVTDRGLYAVQDDARGARRGLWGDREPVAPWQWRKGKNGARVGP